MKSLIFSILMVIVLAIPAFAETKILQDWTQVHSEILTQMIDQSVGSSYQGPDCQVTVQKTAKSIKVIVQKGENDPVVFRLLLTDRPYQQQLQRDQSIETTLLVFDLVTYQMKLSTDPSNLQRTIEVFEPTILGVIPSKSQACVISQE